LRPVAAATALSRLSFRTTHLNLRFDPIQLVAAFPGLEISLSSHSFATSW
jgi:hypothetical protein